MKHAYVPSLTGDDIRDLIYHNRAVTLRTLCYRHPDAIIRQMWPVNGKLWNKVRKHVLYAIKHSTVKPYMKANAAAIIGEHALMIEYANEEITLESNITWVLFEVQCTCHVDLIKYVTYHCTEKFNSPDLVIGISAININFEAFKFWLDIFRPELTEGQHHSIICYAGDDIASRGMHTDVAAEFIQYLISEGLPSNHSNGYLLQEAVKANNCAALKVLVEAGGSQQLQRYNVERFITSHTSSDMVDYIRHNKCVNAQQMC